MSSERTLIRKDVKARLVGKTLAQNRVYTNRTKSLDEADALPAVIVTTKRNRGESLSLGGEPNFRNTLTVLIEPVVVETANDAHEDLLDELAEQIVATLFTDPDWVKQFEKISYVEEEIQYYTQGQRPLASIQMQFDLQFHLQYQPVILNDFVTARINVDAIDPADPNVHPPDGTWPDGYGGQPGPDKRIEVDAELTMEQNP